MSRKLTAKDIEGMVIGADHVGKSKGAWIVRRAYFYRHGYDQHKLADAIKVAIPNAKIIDSGDHYAPFRGGDSVARGSHFWVRFIVGETSSVPNFMKL